jgi:hypothetical protein
MFGACLREFRGSACLPIRRPTVTSVEGSPRSLDASLRDPWLARPCPIPGVHLTLAASVLDGGPPIPSDVLDGREPPTRHRL